MLVLVVEPGIRSIETAVKMGQMAEELGISHVGAIANKITSAGQVDFIRDKMGKIILLGALNYSSFLQEADMKCKAVFNADNQVMEELKRVKKSMEKLLSIPS
jgi:CO dehydrogenase maturation factor